MVTSKRRMTQKDHRQLSGSDGKVLSGSLLQGFPHMFKVIEWYTWELCNLLYRSYASIKGEKKERRRWRKEVEWTSQSSTCSGRIQITVRNTINVSLLQELGFKDPHWVSHLGKHTEDIQTVAVLQEEWSNAGYFIRQNSREIDWAGGNLCNGLEVSVRVLNRVS